MRKRICEKSVEGLVAVSHVVNPLQGSLMDEVGTVLRTIEIIVS